MFTIYLTTRDSNDLIVSTRVAHAHTIRAAMKLAKKAAGRGAYYVNGRYVGAVGTTSWA